MMFWHFSILKVKLVVIIRKLPDNWYRFGSVPKSKMSTAQLRIKTKVATGAILTALSVT